MQIFLPFRWPRAKKSKFLYLVYASSPGLRGSLLDTLLAHKLLVLPYRSPKLLAYR